jgi:hypothetical protein
MGMPDLVFLALAVAFFGLLAFFVMGCARIVGDSLDQ